MTILAGIVRDLPVNALTPCGLTWFGQFLWFSEGFTRRISAVDPHSGEVVHQISCDDMSTDLTTLRGGLLQIVGEDDRLRLLDPGNGATLDEAPNPRPGHAVTGIEAGREGIWMSYGDLGVLDFRSLDGLALLETVSVGGHPTGVTVSDGFVAYADHQRSRLTLLDVNGHHRRLAVSVWGRPSALTWDGRLHWYCDYDTLQLRAVELPGFRRSAGHDSRC
ncbi:MULTISPECIES: NHL repeat-containing protein [Nocardiopsis]|uniref:Glutamine cyclotransferase n=1 Tax=Nocardiopsis sinuspersici TaxID=501010 RepID=A0A1V3BY42_9ACTN|nr:MULTISPECIES: hypothetical protein [Nocardiopsis]OOC53343.1 hypothetical protein NOSIN_05565 [Nocardiopsis sinuspersici]